MRTSQAVALLCALAAGVGAGWLLGRDADAVREARLDGELAELQRRLDAALAERDVARAAAAEAARPREGRRERVRRFGPEFAPSATPDGRSSPGRADGQPAAATPERPPQDAAERKRRVAALAAQVPVWFEQGEGEAALGALRELSALVPEGREEAMRLALAINTDVSGEGRLRLSDVTFYTGLADRNVKELMSWALREDETPPGFRVMAAYSLPWTQPPAATLEEFSAALDGERDLSVQRALVANVARLKDPAAERMLAGLLADADRDPTLRARIATELALTSDARVARTIETAAESDGDPVVRAAARAALVARRPPATGYLVTGTLPASQAEAAGLRAGDVVVSYDGRPTRDLETLRAAQTAASENDLVPLVLVRDGAEVRLLVRPGQLGVFGRGVEAAER